MSEHQFSTEKRILMAMRKTLGSIIKDVTPANSSLKSSLSSSTIDDIRVCFDLISVREKELAEELGVINQDRPRFTDEPNRENVVSITGLKTQKIDTEA